MARGNGSRKEKIADTTNTGRKVNEKFSHEHKPAQIVAKTEKEEEFGC